MLLDEYVRDDHWEMQQAVIKLTEVLQTTVRATRLFSKRLKRPCLLDSNMLYPLALLSVYTEVNEDSLNFTSSSIIGLQTTLTIPQDICVGYLTMLIVC